MNHEPKSTLVKRIQTIVVAVLLVVSIGFGSMLRPTPAHAFVDIPNLIQNTISAVENHAETVKEYILDPLVTLLARTILQSLMRSVINWANNGFEGSPAFVTDLKNNLRNLGDYVAGAF